MAIKPADLEKMNEMVQHGSQIADVWRAFSQYDYGEIYRNLSDSSLLGKKRTITNKLNKLKGKLSQADKTALIDEVQVLVDDIYAISKNNGKKLNDIVNIVHR